MSDRAAALSRRLADFNAEMIAFVESCSDMDWGRLCTPEQWRVAVTARHVADGHYGARGLIRALVAGERLPELKMAEIVAMANRHAEEHPDPSREEVVALLREGGSAVVHQVAAMSDADLDREGFLKLAGGTVSAQKLIELVILGSGGEHLAHMKAAVAPAASGPGDTAA